MTGFRSIFKREMAAYFSTPLAYLFLCVFLAFSGFLTFKAGFFMRGQASLQLFFANMPLLFIFLAPAIAMRLWAEERQTNSIELLFTLPITVRQAVLGKFFAAWTVLALALALTAGMVIMVCSLGSPDPGPIVTGYLASLLLAGSYLAIGSFFSCLTRNQVVAFVLAVGACALFHFAGSPKVLSLLSRPAPGTLVDIVESLSFQRRFSSMSRGVIELRDLAFFIFPMVGWLWASTVALKERMAAG